MKTIDFEKLGYDYGMIFVNAGCDTVSTDFGDPATIADFLEIFDKITEKEVLDNIGLLETGLEEALEDNGYFEAELNYFKIKE